MSSLSLSSYYWNEDNGLAGRVEGLAGPVQSEPDPNPYSLHPSHSYPILPSHSFAHYNKTAREWWSERDGETMRCLGQQRGRETDPCPFKPNQTRPTMGSFSYLRLSIENERETEEWGDGTTHSIGAFPMVGLRACRVAGGAVTLAAISGGDGPGQWQWAWFSDGENMAVVVL